MQGSATKFSICAELAGSQNESIRGAGVSVRKHARIYSMLMREPLEDITKNKERTTQCLNNAAEGP